MKTRKVAIVCDGYTDFLILKRLVQLVLDKKGEALQQEDCFRLDLSLHDLLQKFFKKAFSPSFPDLQKYASEICGVLHTAYRALQREWEVLTPSDILLVHSDSERKLGNNHFFQDWVFSLQQLFHLAIHLFYEHSVSHFPSLPLIVSLIPFPSSEIILAAGISKFRRDWNQTRQQAPSNLKEQLKKYWKQTSESYPRLLEQKLPQWDVELEDVYRYLPEVRQVIQVLLA